MHDDAFNKLKMINKKRILITGGAGYLGNYVAQVLIRYGYAIRTIDIMPNVRDIATAGIEVYTGDIRDYSVAYQATEGVDYVIHAASEVPYGKREDICSIMDRGTSNVFTAAEKNKVERVVHISSPAVYGLQMNGAIEENAELRPQGLHGESKLLAERICEKFRKKGMVVSVLRPTPLVGAGRLGIFQIFFDWISEGRKIPVIGNGRNRLQLMNTGDLSEAIYCTIKAPATVANDVFNVGAERFGMLKDDFKEFISEVQSRSRLFFFPSLPIKYLLYMLEITRLSPIYGGVYKIIDKDLTISIEKIKKQLGWYPRKSNVESLVEAYTWYQKCKETVQFDYGKSNRTLLKKGILKLIKRAF